MFLGREWREKAVTLKFYLRQGLIVDSEKTDFHHFLYIFKG